MIVNAILPKFTRISRVSFLLPILPSNGVLIVVIIVVVIVVITSVVSIHLLIPPFLLSLIWLRSLLESKNFRRCIRILVIGVLLLLHLRLVYILLSNNILNKTYNSIDMRSRCEIFSDPFRP